MLEKYQEVITVDELCEILHIGRNTAYALLKSKEIANIKTHHRYIIPKQSVVVYLTRISEGTDMNA